MAVIDVFPNLSFVLKPKSDCVPVIRVLRSGMLTLPASMSCMMSSSSPSYLRVSLFSNENCVLVLYDILN